MLQASYMMYRFADGLHNMLQHWGSCPLIWPWFGSRVITHVHLGLFLTSSALQLAGEVRKFSDGFTHCVWLHRYLEPERRDFLTARSLLGLAAW